MAQVNEYVEFDVDSVRRSLKGGRIYILILKERDGSRFLPIWMNGFTTRAIIAAFTCRQYPNLSLTCLVGFLWPVYWLLGLRYGVHPELSSLDWRARRLLLAGDGIRRFALTALEDHFLRARLDFETGAWSPQPLSVRCKDALVLAARQQRPIHVAKGILDKVGLTQPVSKEEE